MFIARHCASALIGVGSTLQCKHCCGSSPAQGSALSVFCGQRFLFVDGGVVFATTANRVCSIMWASPQLLPTLLATLRVTLPRTSQLALRGTTHRLRVEPTILCLFLCHIAIDASIRLYNTKRPQSTIEVLSLLSFVGMTRFELATTRPPDVYSNRAELHPELVLRVQR